jgi:hypothetical protein
MTGLRTVSIIALCVGLAGLAVGCKPKGGEAAKPAAAASGAAGGGGEVEITEAQLPHPRAGAWERTDPGDEHGAPDRFCVVDRPFSIGRLRTSCQKFVFHRSAGGGVTIDSECGRGGVSSKMHMAAVGDFQSAYSTDVQMAITLKPGEPPHMVSTKMNYRYVGACTPAEQAQAVAADKGQ